MGGGADRVRVGQGEAAGGQVKQSARLDSAGASVQGPHVPTVPLTSVTPTLPGCKLEKGRTLKASGETLDVKCRSVGSRVYAEGAPLPGMPLALAGEEGGVGSPGSLVGPRASGGSAAGGRGSTPWLCSPPPALRSEGPCTPV